MQDAGSQINIAEFGKLMYWTGKDALDLEEHDLEVQDGAWTPVDAPEQGGRHWGLAWESPRQFYKIVVRYRSKDEMPTQDQVKLQYWRHNWPAPFHGGWTAVDDPYNGQWITAHGDVSIDGAIWTYAFDPLDFTEIDRVNDFAVFYRQSYRFRLLYKPDAKAVVTGVEAYSDSTWADAEVAVEFEGGSEYTGGVEVYNGYLLDLDDSDSKNLKLKVRYAVCERQTRNADIAVPPDRTIVTVNAKPRDFSFLVTDALTEPLLVKDLGVTIRNGERKTRDPKPEAPPIYDRILTEPEQSYERASAEIPQLAKIRQGERGRYVPIGCEANRQEFAYRYNGDIFADKHAMKAMGRDTARLLWPGRAIYYKFPTGDPPDFRYREDGTTQSAMNGYLPIFTSEWKDREIHFSKTVFACLMCESPWHEEEKRGDEPVIAMMRCTIRNTTEEARTARLWMVIEEPEALEVKDGFVYATGRIYNEAVPVSWQAIEKRWPVRPYDERRLRAFVDTKARGDLVVAPCCYEPYQISSHPNAVAYDVLLQPRESHTIEVRIPFITFTNGEGEDLVRSLDYDAKLREMVEYWEAQIAAGAKIETPEPLINDYVKATVPHIGITVDKDVESGLYMVPAGTYGYQVCANEACHQIRSLDLRSHHDRARTYLETFVKLQGTRPLHGKFKTQEGVLHGLKVSEDTDYQHFNYNLDHGFVHFQLCEHYFLTRDKEWAAARAENLIKACDFVTRERQWTMKLDGNGEKVWEYGLIPPGHLEDNPEWLYWYAVNGYCYRGMRNTAEVLRDIGHSEADRIAKDAEDYRQDIYRSMSLSLKRAPVVRLADGSYQPFMPTRALLRSRDVGWIRDSLYGPIHCIECGVMEPWDPMATWILKDTEDNVFVSRYRGRQVDLERYWFSQGGNTIQSGLLPIVMVYVKRDQPEHAIRALYNGLGQNLYPDVRCFTEHPVVAFGLGQGPFYKTPDENCWIVWLRHILLSEIGYDTLRICPAAPRAWFRPGKTFEVVNMATYFGPTSFRIESFGDRIVTEIEPPTRNAPCLLELRLRHPEKAKMKRVKVDGKPHDDVDAEREIVKLSELRGRMLVEAQY